MHVLKQDPVNSQLKKLKKQGRLSILSLPCSYLQDTNLLSSFWGILLEKGAINHGIPDFCCSGHYQIQGKVFNEHSLCSKHFSSSALILFQNCFLKALQHMVLWRKKKVAQLVLIHLFSTDKKRFTEIMLNKTDVEYTLLKAFLLSSGFKGTCRLLPELKQPLSEPLEKHRDVSQSVQKKVYVTSCSQCLCLNLFCKCSEWLTGSSCKQLWNCTSEFQKQARHNCVLVPRGRTLNKQQVFLNEVNDLILRLLCLTMPSLRW